MFEWWLKRENSVSLLKKLSRVKVPQKEVGGQYKLIVISIIENLVFSNNYYGVVVWNKLSVCITIAFKT